MSKITFRADEALVERLEAIDASKSEVMRDALRYYLDTAERDHPMARGDRHQQPTRSHTRETNESIDELIARRIDQAVADRVESVLNSTEPHQHAAAPDVTVNVSLDGLEHADPSNEQSAEPATTTRKTIESEQTDRQTPHASEPHAHSCSQCGESVDSSHVYCPNCGEKASHKAFCECGDELRSDWAFCPTCGRRTPAANVLDNT